MDEHSHSAGKADRYFGENRPYAGLGRASVHSGIILVAARGVGIAVQLTSMVLLARLLSPRDFGLVAMIFALTDFGMMLIDLGTTDACTQKKYINPADVSSLFWLNIAVGALLTALLVGAGGLIASFYGEADLAQIARFSSLAFILTALSIQHRALMRRAMEFRQLALIDVSSNVASSLLSIAVAFAGWGYWALVAKSVSFAGLTLLGAWMSCPWLPGRPQFTTGAKEAVRFGLGVTGFGMTDYLARSADRLALGYFLGAATLGYYQNALLLYNNLLSLLSEPLHNIAATALSKLRQNLEEFRRSWSMGLSAVSFLSGLVFAVLAATGQDLIVILLGQKWAPAGPLVCIFGVRGIAHTIERTLGWLHVAVGRPDRWLKWGVFSSVIQLAALFMGIPFGLTGVATAYLITTFILFVPALAFAGRPVEIGTSDVLAAVGPQTISGLCVAGFGFFVQQFVLGGVSEFLRFTITSAICVVMYLALTVGIFKVTGPLKLAFSIFRDAGGARSREFHDMSRTSINSFERFLITLEGWPGIAISRTTLGVCILPLIRKLSAGHESIFVTLLLFLGVLVALRLIPALLRRLVPFSEEAKSVWLGRRELAKRYDSYQWQKLFWMGLGSLAYASFGAGLRSGEVLVTGICLIGGGVGILLWLRRRDDARRSAG